MSARVLIVDDISNNRQLLKTVLGDEMGLEITESDSGLDAVNRAKTQKFDLVFMDIMMPDIDGYQAAANIKRHPLNQDTTVIFITAHDNDRHNVQKAFDTGGIDYITKPVNLSHLRKLVKLYLRFIDKEKAVSKKLIALNANLQAEIEQRKETEEKLERSRANFKNIVGKSEAAILIVDNEGSIRFVNKAAEIIFDRDADSLIGKSFGYVAQFEKKTEINILRKDQSLGFGEITSTKTNWENKPAWLLLINDITAHKKLEVQLRKAKEKAQESDRLKSAFLSNMSHEIRTPMNGILGFLDFIDEEPEAPKRKEFTDIIRTSGNHLLNLINDIIDISKIEAGQLDIRTGECNIDKLLLEQYLFFEKDIKIKAQNINLELKITVKNEETVIKTDEARLKQILINLLNNAMNFTNNGTVQFGYNIKNNELEFFVKDNGIGMPKERLNSIFDRFIQIKDERTDFVQGTGLGLAISKSLTELLGGKIRVESEVKKGSAFYFTVPLVRSTLETPEFLSPVPVEKPDGKLKGKNILIVEDEEINFHLLRSILEKRGACITWAQTGNEAIEKTDRLKPDLILIDIKLPGISGLEATKQIRKHEFKGPIIAQTAYALHGEKDMCYEAGCNDYLSKPIMKDNLLKVLAEYL